MKYALLASGSKGNACLIKSKTTTLLVDCGTTQKYLKQCFQSLQVSLEQIQAVLITHTHADHVAAINLFKHHEVYAHHQSRLARFTPIEENVSFTIGDIDILPIATSHDSHGSVGYRFESDGEVLVYVTDTGYLASHTMTSLQNADYYIFESNHDVEMLMQTARPWSVKKRILSDEGHLSNEDASLHLANLIGEKTKDIVLAHLSEEGNHPQLAYDVLMDTLVQSPIDESVIRIRPSAQWKIMIGGK